MKIITIEFSDTDLVEVVPVNYDILCSQVNQNDS